MLHHASKKLTKALCAIGITIAAMAQTTLAEVVVQGTPILRPSIVWPNDFAQWGTDYGGTPPAIPPGDPDDPWPDQSGQTSFEQEYDLTHSYNPATMTLSLENAFDEDKTKHVWIRLRFDWQGNNPAYPASIGEQPDPNQWATMEVETDGDQNRIPILTGAAWFTNPLMGQLIVEQSWSIHPQPKNETINLSNIIGNAGGPGVFKGLMSETVCIPEPAALSLLALGGLVAARRRRP